MVKSSRIEAHEAGPAVSAGYPKDPKPDYAGIHPWEAYSADLLTEYQQSTEEGLDIAVYRDIFTGVSQLEQNELKEKLADTLFEAVRTAPVRSDYAYCEPSGLQEIRSLRDAFPLEGKVPARDLLQKKIHGAWMGRICGCMFGKTIEGIRSDELVPFLRETGNYPLHRYITSSDLTDELCSRCKFDFRSRFYADQIEYMPYDDDTNYTVLGQEIIETYGRDFTPHDVARAWLHYQPKDAYCTAERVAFRNFVNGYEPPQSAVYKNPYREWIGAQIRADYFGYINPGDPETAAGMAFRDACISHVKNGIYGEMFVAAMLACAAVTDDIEAIIRGGLAQIPRTSRLYESVMRIIGMHRSGAPFEACLETVRGEYDEYTGHGWCHTISNAMIVAAALLYGEKDYSRSICLAVGCAYDTDCNGATVGSVLGMVLGIDALDPVWTAPIHDTLETTLFGMHFLRVSELAEKTMKHIR